MEGALSVAGRCGHRAAPRRGVDRRTSVAEPRAAPGRGDRLVNGAVRTPLSRFFRVSALVVLLAAPLAGQAANDPVEAYREQRYEEALRGFERWKSERPDEPLIDLNLGSARYKLGQLDAATQSYQSAAKAAEEAGEADLRSEALYNLGNAAFRAGRLAEAEQLFLQALDLAPGDVDAKHNLEVVQRRLEEQQQNQDGGQDQDQDQEQDGGDQDSDAEQRGDSPQSGGGEQERDDSEADGAPDHSESSSDGAPGADEDEDGLSDEQERSAENPTDPSNPDSDGDGRLDGEEDANRNGRVDPGETDPNQPDPPQSEPSEPRQGDGRPQSSEPAGMTPEEAQRFLQALQEERPAGERRARAGQLRQEKDW
ncbi:MAG: tetratricopeptide repeat protein [Acidobacteria bacterium]|nr:MAG: tetratricopeptide repeat protein [Acidobacteriota bacterium]